MHHPERDFLDRAQGHIAAFEQATHMIGSADTEGATTASGLEQSQAEFVRFLQTLQEYLATAQLRNDIPAGTSLPAEDLRLRSYCA